MSEQLSSSEKIRKRPGMYVGSVGVSGIHQLFYSVFDGMAEGARSCGCTKITVKLMKGGMVEIEENGGVSVKGPDPVLIALSESLETETYDGRHVLTEKYSRGTATEKPHVTGDTDRTGAKVRFLADGGIFDTLEYDGNEILEHIREKAFFCAGVTFAFQDERNGDLCYKDGVCDFVRYRNKNTKPLHEEVIYMTGGKNGVTAEIAMQYTVSFNENIYSYVNCNRTEDGGAHEEGFKKALTASINGFVKKTAPDDAGFTVQDVCEGLTAIVSVRMERPEFAGETKTRLDSEEAEDCVFSLVSGKLSGFLEKEPETAGVIINKITDARRAREALETARSKS